MKSLAYGKGYKYAHDQEGKVADMDCLPEALLGRRYIEPQSTGDEAEIKRRLEEAEAKKSKNEKTE